MHAWLTVQMLWQMHGRTQQAVHMLIVAPLIGMQFAHTVVILPDNLYADAFKQSCKQRRCLCLSAHWHDMQETCVRVNSHQDIFGPPNTQRADKARHISKITIAWLHRNFCQAVIICSTCTQTPVRNQTNHTMLSLTNHSADRAQVQVIQVRVLTHKLHDIILTVVER